MRESKLMKLVSEYGICYINKYKRLVKLSPDEIVYRFSDYQFVSYHIASDRNDDIIEFLEEFDTGYFNQLWTINNPKYIKRFAKNINL